MRVVLGLLIVLSTAARPSDAQPMPLVHSRWAVHGEMGVARAAQQTGLMVGVGPSVKVARATLSAWIDGLFTGSIAADSLRLDAGEVRCGRQPIGVGDPQADQCLGRSELQLGGMLEATMPLAEDVPIRAGVGYRVGAGRGPTAVLAFDKSFRKATTISVAARVGERFLSVRVGARLTP